MAICPQCKSQLRHEPSTGFYYCDRDSIRYDSSVETGRMFNDHTGSSMTA